VEGATIGYGHLIAKSEWSKYKNGITKAQADTFFNTDLTPFVNSVKNKVSAKILQQEFDAMVILTFNIGSSSFGSSSVLKLVNDPNATTSYASLEEIPGQGYERA
jgi:lysozyme